MSALLSWFRWRWRCLIDAWRVLLHGLPQGIDSRSFSIISQPTRDHPAPIGPPDRFKVVYTKLDGTVVVHSCASGPEWRDMCHKGVYLEGVTNVIGLDHKVERFRWPHTGGS